MTVVTGWGQWAEVHAVGKAWRSPPPFAVVRFAGRAPKPDARYACQFKA